MKTTMAALLTVLAVSATVQIAAPESHAISEIKGRQQKQTVARLKSAQDGLARRADQTKGGPRQQLLLERAHLDRLIDDLEHGKTVPSEEIDRALQRAEQGTP